MKRIMLTCANGQVGPSVLSLMRMHPDYDIRLVGVAAGDLSTGLGAKFCDAFYEVPMGSSPDYWNAIRGVIEREGVNLVFIGSDEEALVLSSHSDELKQMNCAVACSPHVSCLTASDKFSLASRLEACGVAVGRYSAPESVEDLVNFAEECGYPEQDVVLKPRFGRGSKGLRIISNEFDAYDAFYSGLKGYATLEQMVQLFSDYPQHISEYMLMEYLPGDKYSSDMLVSNGKTICSVIRCNGPVPKVSPPTQLADIVFDRDVEEYACRVAEVLEADYFLQVECGRDSAGDVKIIETNIRLDATLPITTGVGVNFYREIMTYAFEGSFRDMPLLPGNPEKHLRFVRYWQHDFVEV